MALWSDVCCLLLGDVKLYAAPLPIAPGMHQPHRDQTVRLANEEHLFDRPTGPASTVQVEQILSPKGFVAHSSRSPQPAWTIDQDQHATNVIKERITGRAVCAHTVENQGQFVRGHCSQPDL